MTDRVYLSGSSGDSGLKLFVHHTEMKGLESLERCSSFSVMLSKWRSEAMRYPEEGIGTRSTRCLRRKEQTGSNHPVAHLALPLVV